MRKIIKHHIEGGTRESHPRVQDLLHPRLGKPRRGLQILDTRMGFPRPSPSVVLDYINPPILTPGEMLSHPEGWVKPIPEVIHNDVTESQRQTI